MVDALLVLHGLNVSESLDLSEHVSSLALDKVDVSLELSNLASDVNDLVALGVTLISKFSRLKEFLVQNSLGSLELVLKLHVLSLLLRHHVLEVFDLLAAVSNLIHASVESGSSLHFRPNFLLTQEFVPVLHGENFIVNSSVVSLLVLKVVKLLSQLSDQLVFIRASDFHSSLSLNQQNRLAKINLCNLLLVLLLMPSFGCVFFLKFKIICN